MEILISDRPSRLLLGTGPARAERRRDPLGKGVRTRPRRVAAPHTRAETEAGPINIAVGVLPLAKCVHLAIAAPALHSVPALESEAEAIIGDIADCETIARTRRRRTTRRVVIHSRAKAIMRNGEMRGSDRCPHRPGSRTPSARHTRAMDQIRRLPLDSSSLSTPAGDALRGLLAGSA